MIILSKIKNTLIRIFNKNSTGILNTVIESIDNSLTLSSEDLKQLDLEYIIKSSTGIWLDEWGTWFGVSRVPGESDESYRGRILAICTKPKGTIPAIQDAIKAYIGDPNAIVQIYEPFTDIKKFNISLWGSQARYQDGSYYIPGVIDIAISVDPTQELRNIVQQIKFAGIKVYYTMIIQLSENNYVIRVLFDSKSIVETLIEKEKEIVVYDRSLGAKYSVYSPRSEPLSGYQNLWMGDRELLTEFSPMSLYQDKAWTRSELFFVNKGSYSVNMFRSGNTAGFSGYPITQYDIDNPLPFIENVLIFKTDILVPTTQTPVKKFNVENIKEITVFDRSLGARYSVYSNEPLSGYRNLWIDTRELTTEISRVPMYRTVTANSDMGWEGFENLEDIFDILTVDELNLVEDRQLGSFEREIIPV